MFLDGLEKKFTFYNIYIKTQKDVKKKIYNMLNLHSTIFILKPINWLSAKLTFKFTFYNIYIKTKWKTNFCRIL